ncbi:nuclear transport factor 2 family protein [Nonomuraea turcica]|uniref:nuclear transport factor 2 family protein n=1 Tax=Nonomuraea sp. G32 TaxID=3067274 RepID=UPI00273C603B|nr:nuclear transport factor 2 family protein [Nonomuraea sp. G32]MDP4504891.1 nuclear transport factor 2 family protein [Nonomuraea sp. G32]
MSTDTLTADRVEIAELFARFARLLDEKRWEDVATVFADDVAVHSPRGGVLHGIDAIVDFMRRSDVEGQRAQHLTTDLLAEVDGDRATVSAYSLVFYYRDGQAPHFTGGLRMTGALVRTPAGWRFREQRIAPLWTREN